MPIVLGAGLALAYVTTVALGVALLRDQDSTRKALAVDASTIQSLRVEVRAARSDVAALQSRLNQPGPIPVPTVSPSAVAPPPSVAPAVYPSLIKVADNMGNVWLGGTAGAPAASPAAHPALSQSRSA